MIRGRAATADELFQNFAKTVVLTRLIEEIVGAKLHAATAILLRGVVGENQNGDARLCRFLTQSFEDIEPVTLLELEVQHHCVVRCGSQSGYGVRLGLRETRDLDMV